LSVSDNNEPRINPSLLEDISFELGTDSSKLKKKTYKTKFQPPNAVEEIPFHESVNSGK